MSSPWLVLAASCGAIATLAAAASGRARALRAYLGVALALGASGTVMSASLLAGTPPAPAAALAAALAAGLAAVLAPATATGRVTPASEAVPRWLLVVFAASIALAAFAVARRAATEPEGGWDALMIWNLRAKMLYALGPDVRAAFPPEVTTSHPDYPVLLPGLVVQGWTAAGGVTSRVPFALSVGIALAATAVLTAGVATVRGPRAALLAATLLATTPAFVLAAGAQYADQLVALFVVSSAIAAWLGLERDRATPLLPIAGLLASFAAWTKNEGALFALALGLGIALREGARFRRASARPLLAYAAGAAPVLALYVWFRLAIAPPSVFLHEPAGVHLARAIDPARIATALLYLARRLVYFQAFGLHVVAAVALLGVLARRGALSRPAPRALAVALGVAWTGFFATYVISPFDVKWLVQHSADRLLLQYLPYLLFLLFAASRPGPCGAGAAPPRG